MSDPVYDWFKDFFLPGFVGIGTTMFGLGAVLAARRANGAADESNGLAAEVRADELKREVSAARERYRDQLFRVVEPGVTAVLAHRAELMKTHRLGTPAEGILRADVVSRLWLIMSVASAEDAKLVDATSDALQDGIKTGRSDVVVFVLGQIALMLPSLLRETRDIDKLVMQTNGFVTSGMARHASTSPPAKGQPTTT